MLSNSKYDSLIKKEPVVKGFSKDKKFFATDNYEKSYLSGQGATFPFSG